MKSFGAVALMQRRGREHGIADMMVVEIPAEQYRKLKLTEGETLMVRPKRMQVFLKDGAASVENAANMTHQAASIAENR